MFLIILLSPIKGRVIESLLYKRRKIVDRLKWYMEWQRVVQRMILIELNPEFQFPKNEKYYMQNFRFRVEDFIQNSGLLWIFNLTSHIIFT